MAITRRPANFLGAAALIAAAVAPAALSAQAGPGVRSTTGVIYHLMQLSVDTSEVELEEFKAQTETIGSCRDARLLAEPLGAEVTRNRHVPEARLPDSLREALSEVETGHASEVFSADGSVMRVIVICGRS